MNVLHDIELKADSILQPSASVEQKLSLQEKDL
jgi:hypothetical protein